MKRPAAQNDALQPLDGRASRAVKRQNTHGKRYARSALSFGPASKRKTDRARLRANAAVERQ